MEILHYLTEFFHFESQHSFRILLVLMVFTWLGGQFFKRILRLPPVLGAIVSGILVGPSILNIVPETEFIMVLAELGMFILMFHAGLEEAIAYIDDDELVEVTPNAVRLRKRFLDPHERKRQARAAE